MTTFITAPASQTGALLNLPLEVRGKIYRFVFHNNPRCVPGRLGGPRGNRLNVKIDASACRRTKFITDIEGVTYPLKIGNLDANRRLTPISRTCQRCYTESDNLFYENIYLGFQDAELVLPFFVRNLRDYLPHIKHVNIDLHSERLGYLDPTISWTAIVPNLKTFVLEVCEVHEWDEKDFDIYTSDQKLRRARKWLESLPDFLQECKAPRSFHILVNIKSFNFNDDVECDDEDEYFKTCGVSTPWRYLLRRANKA